MALAMPRSRIIFDVRRRSPSRDEHPIKTNSMKTMPQCHNSTDPAAHPTKGLLSPILALLVGVFLGPGEFALAQNPHDHGKNGPTVQVLSSVDVSELVDGKSAKVTTLEVTFEPLASGAPHRHPGAVFGYVLEGTLETQVGDTPIRALKTGETFYEPTMALHAVSRNPSDKVRTRVLAVMLHPKEAKELVIPEPVKGGK